MPHEPIGRAVPLIDLDGVPVSAVRRAQWETGIRGGTGMQPRYVLLRRLAILLEPVVFHQRAGHVVYQKRLVRPVRELLEPRPHQREVDRRRLRPAALRRDGVPGDQLWRDGADTA